LLVVVRHVVLEIVAWDVVRPLLTHVINICPVGLVHVVSDFRRIVVNSIDLVSHSLLYLERTRWIIELHPLHIDLLLLVPEPHGPSACAGWTPHSRLADRWYRGAHGDRNLVHALVCAVVHRVGAEIHFNIFYNF